MINWFIQIVKTLIALTLLNGFEIWLVHNCETEEDHLNIRIVTAVIV